jgi:hypothetical protein
MFLVIQLRLVFKTKIMLGSFVLVITFFYLKIVWKQVLLVFYRRRLIINRRSWVEIQECAIFRESFFIHISFIL